MRRLLPWLAVWSLAGAMAAVTTSQSLVRYREFRSGWAWDLAYNNQCGTGPLVFDDQGAPRSARSTTGATEEGRNRSRCRTAPRPDPHLLFVPIYALWPGPETLLVIHNVVVWWIVPAVFGLVRSESGSTGRALLAAALVPLTPLLWPLAWNDFREMALALPFIVWAIEGFRRRRVGLAALGAVGMMLCREEYGILVATLAALPAPRGEDVGTTYRWARAAVAAGLGWFLLGFFGYQYFFVAPHAPRVYREHFGGPKPGPLATAGVAADLLAFGLGPWALLAALAPRIALLALPWVVGLCRGRWALNLMHTPMWSQVQVRVADRRARRRGGAVGFARLAGRTSGRAGRWPRGGISHGRRRPRASGRRGRVRGPARRAMVPRSIGRDEAEEDPNAGSAGSPPRTACSPTTPT